MQGSSSTRLPSSSTRRARRALVRAATDRRPHAAAREHTERSSGRNARRLDERRRAGGERVSGAIGRSARRDDVGADGPRDRGGNARHLRERCDGNRLKPRRRGTPRRSGAETCAAVHRDVVSGHGVRELTGTQDENGHDQQHGEDASVGLILARHAVESTPGRRAGTECSLQSATVTRAGRPSPAQPVGAEDQLARSVCRGREARAQTTDGRVARFA